MKTLLKSPEVNTFSTAKSIGLALILFVIVYAPAFALVALLRPNIRIAIPLIIIVSAGLVALIMVLLARSARGIREFGVAISSPSYMLTATVAGILVGYALAYLAAAYPVQPPFDVSQLRPWMIFLYFIVGSPVQEELIFRGLLQTTMTRAISRPSGFWAVHFPVIFVAVLFGVIHLGSGHSCVV